MTKKSIQPYQDTFMELDPTCKGTLDIDELKVVMVTLGYLLDEDELQVRRPLCPTPYPTLSNSWTTSTKRGRGTWTSETSCT
jgi:hypothetical protein